MVRCSALTRHFVQGRSSAVQVRSYYAAEMLICGTQYPSLRGFTVAAPGSSCNLYLCLCLRRMLTCQSQII